MGANFLVLNTLLGPSNSVGMQLSNISAALRSSWTSRSNPQSPILIKTNTDLPQQLGFDITKCGVFVSTTFLLSRDIVGTSSYEYWLGYTITTDKHLQCISTVST